jgi:hypothetical protein
VDLGHLERLVIIEGREDGREAPREQRFASAGRPHHEQVMSTGGRHLERFASSRQAPNDGKIRDDIVLEIVARTSMGLIRRRRPDFLALEGGSDLRQGCGRQDTHSGDQAGFRRILSRQQNGARTGAAQCVDHGQDAGNGPQRTVESEFADDANVVENAVWQLIGGHHQPQRKGKIEPWPRFPYSARRQVHGHPTDRPGEPGGQQGGPDPVS